MSTNKNKGADKRREMKFRCPDCGGDQIAERMKDKRRIRVFEDGTIDISALDGWDTYNCFYLCSDCGSIIRHDKWIYIKDREHLGKWLSHRPEWEAQEESNMNSETFLGISVEIGSAEEALPPGELRFVCPECGANELDECWVTETPIKLYEDGSVDLGYPDYHGSDYEYRCRRCQWVLQDEDGLTVDKETLVDFLKHYSTTI